MSLIDALSAFALFRLFEGQGGGGGGGGGLLSPLAPSPEVAPSSPAVPVAPLWPSAVPPDLPPFPGDGWEYDAPVSTPVVQRAVALVPVLWAQGQGAHTTEMTAGHWVTYLAEWLNGKHGVTAWRLKRPGAGPSLDNVRPGMPSVVIPKPAESLVSPVAAPKVVVVPAPGGPVVVKPAAPSIVTPSAPFVPAATSLDSPPPLLGKYPGPGAYMSNPTWIRKYQTALIYLAAKTGNADWNVGPKGADGKFGADTKAGVLAFQKYNGVKPYDGAAGAATGAAIDHWLSSMQQA